MTNYTELFTGIDSKVKLSTGNTVIPINFDNGATTPPLKSVVKAINENINNYGPIARGVGQKGDICTKRFEDARDTILDFFNLKGSDTHTVIFTKSTTEGMNLLANILIKDKSQTILTTRMEHHANDLPWRYTCNVLYVEVDRLGRINIDEIEQKLISNKGSIKYVSLTAASNVTGYMNPIHDIAKICHKYSAKIIVDGAQIVAHKKVDMKGTDTLDQIDFLVFSAHKVYAPFGSGAIIGLKEYLKNVDPFLKGGGCVEGVFDDFCIWNNIPNRLEAGTQNYFGTIAMSKSLTDLKAIGLDNVYSHEMEIKNHLIGNMAKMDRVILYGDTQNIEDRLGVIGFNVENIVYEDVAKKMANDMGIALRCGKFCAHPYVYRLMGISDLNGYIDVASTNEDIGMIRASIGLYNTLEEANTFLNALEYIIKTM
ncbi:MAG: aminotransferase class V-fold PLP-dependent enzyme [Romboutsia sp.]